MKPLLALLVAGTSLSAQSLPRRIEPIRVEKKMALVVGNASYRSTSPLTNPLTDARAITAVLRNSLHFDEVTEMHDLTLPEMEQAVDAFTNKLQAGDLGLFYFSGHGLQVQHENYLLPVEYAKRTEAAVKYTAFPASRVRDQMEASGARLRVLILDACRNNPFQTMRGVNDGLSAMRGQAEGTLIVFATGDGNVAEDNPREPNGLFTKHLLAAMTTSGLNLKEMFEKVKEEVYYASQRQQNPYTYDNVVGQYYPLGEPKPGPTNTDTSLQAEVVYWNAVDPNDVVMLESYLARYPQGQYAELAGRRLERLRQPAQSAELAANHPAAPTIGPDTLEKVAGLWEETNDWSGRLLIRHHMTEHYERFRGRAKRSVQVVNSQDGFTARWRESRVVTNLDKQGEQTIHLEASFRLKHQGVDITGYAESARVRDDSGSWVDLGSVLFNGTLRATGQLEYEIIWSRTKLRELGDLIWSTGINPERALAGSGTLQKRE